MSARWFKFTGEGLARVLGALEAEVMEAIWRIGQGTIQDVCETLEPGHNSRTVATVMNRLVEKELLSRETGEGRALVYRPTRTREAFVEHIFREVLQGLIRDFGGAGLVPFVDALEELSPDTLAELERLVRERRAKDGGDA